MHCRSKLWRDTILQVELETLDVHRVSKHSCPPMTTNNSSEGLKSTDLALCDEVLEALKNRRFKKAARLADEMRTRLEAALKTSNNVDEKKEDLSLCDE